MGDVYRRNELTNEWAADDRSPVDRQIRVRTILMISTSALAIIGLAAIVLLRREPSEPSVVPTVTHRSHQKKIVDKPSEVKPPISKDQIGVLLGDSVIRGFGSGPVYYDNNSPTFDRSAYRFVASMDKPIASLAGYQGIQTWLNRGVTGNTSTGTLARWQKDVVERLDRGSQRKRHLVRTLLVSAGFNDIAKGIQKNRLRSAEATMRKNLLAMVKKARAQGIQLAFLESPDPTVAPLGERFSTLAGTPVIPFFEEQAYGEETHREFNEAVRRTRTFMEKGLESAGAKVIDYASFLPPPYFWDSHHPSIPGYVELGRLLREQDSGTAIQ